VPLGRGLGRGAGRRLVTSRYAINACFEKAGTYLVARARRTRATPVLSSHTASYPGRDRPDAISATCWAWSTPTSGCAPLDPPSGVERFRVFRCAGISRGRPAAGADPADHNTTFLLARQRRLRKSGRAGARRHHRTGTFRFRRWRDRAQAGRAPGLHPQGHREDGRRPRCPRPARLAGRVSGDSTVAHAWGACMAMERAAGWKCRTRALAARPCPCASASASPIMSVTSARCSTTSPSPSGFYQFARLRENGSGFLREAFGHRFHDGLYRSGRRAADLDARFVATMRDEAGAFAQTDRQADGHHH